MSRTAKQRSRTSEGPIRSEASRLAILAAAQRVLDRDGLQAFTIEAVAKEARASKPTIYKWWGDKHSLLAEVYRLATPLLDGPGEINADLHGRLTDYYRHLWSIWNRSDNAETTRWLFRTALASESTIEKYKETYLSARTAPVKAVLAQAKEIGELPATADADLMLDMLLGYHLLRVLMNEPVSLDEIQDCLAVVLSGTAALARRSKTDNVEKFPPRTTT